jgi:2',3'-cyclic-nucleotide 2'-phosphodiesterase (5'-nucleotidase family)
LLKSAPTDITSSMKRQALAVMAVAGGLAGASACTEDQPQPNLVGQDIRLTIIHTSDIHSRLFPYNFVPNTFDQGYGLIPRHPPSPFVSSGGIARISTLVKRIRATSERSLWLDSGDAWQGAPVFNDFHGEAEIRALSLAGMEGEVLGNHEFDTGSTNLYNQLTNWSQFPHLAANYAWDDVPNKTQRSLKDIISPFQIYDVKGVQVGVIGLGNTDTLLSSYQGGNSLGFRALAEADALQQWERILRPICDLIVVSSHLGLDEDEGLSPSQVVDPNEALPLTGIDLILGGHLHIVTNPSKVLPNDDGSMYCKTHDCRTVLQHSGAFGKYVGRLDLVVHMGTNNANNETRSRITSFAYLNQPVDETVPDDPDMTNLLLPYSIKLSQDIDLAGVFSYVSSPTPTTTIEIARNDPSGGDSQLGNLVARSMQAQQGVDAQFALTNSLGIRDDFYQGPLTNEQMFNVFPFENTIVVIYLSGNEIQEMLDFVSQRSATRGCQTQAQVAGIAYDMVCSGTCDPAVHGLDPTTGMPATACAKNIYIGDNCRDAPDKPINPATTKCAALQPTGLYRAAVNDYIAAGGSGFDVLRRNSSQQNTGVSLRAALTVYLSNQPATCDGTATSSITDTQDATHMPQQTIAQNWGPISCLGTTIEPHDGRIRPVFE